MGSDRGRVPILHPCCTDPDPDLGFGVLGPGLGVLALDPEFGLGFGVPEVSANPKAAEEDSVLELPLLLRPEKNLILIVSFLRKIFQMVFRMISNDFVQSQAANF